MEGVKEESSFFQKTHIRLISLILIIIVVTIISVTIFYFLGGKENNPVREVVNSIIPSLDDEESEEPAPIISGSSGGSGGGSGSGGGGSGSGDNCTQDQISYALISVNRTSVCNVEQNGVCLDKTVSCLFEVHNYDNEISGAFEVELLYVEQGKTQNEAFDLEVRTLIIGPRQFEVFQDSTNVQSTGSNGTANQVINCFFHTLNVPTKEVCV